MGWVWTVIAGLLLLVVIYGVFVYGFPWILDHEFAHLTPVFLGPYL